MILEPPCTTFSLARRPALRNSHEPEGFDAEGLKTNEGNIFGLLCCILCLAQWTSGNEYLMEQSAYGHMRVTIWWLLVLHLGATLLSLHGADTFGQGRSTLNLQCSCLLGVAYSGRSCSKVAHARNHMSSWKAV